MISSTKLSLSWLHVSQSWHELVILINLVCLFSRRARRQDIKHGDPASQCWDTEDSLVRGRVEERVLYGVQTNSTFLECIPKSQQAQIRWYIQRPRTERKEEVRLDDRVVHTDRGLLIRSLHASDAGVYFCVAQEHTHFTHTLLHLNLQLVTHGKLDGRPKPSEDPVVESRQRYKDYLRVMSSPFSSLEEYCDSLWLEKKPSRVRGRGLGAGKWKHMQEMRKSRNRRQHREREEEWEKQERGRVVRTAQQWGVWYERKKHSGLAVHIQRVDDEAERDAKLQRRLNPWAGKI